MRGLSSLGDRWRRIDPMAVDLGVAGVVLASQLALLIQADLEPGCHLPWWGYVLGACNAVPLIWRRRAPFVVLLLVAAAVIAYERMHQLPDMPMQYGVLVAIYTVAELGKPWQRVFTLVVSPFGVLIATGTLVETLLDKHFPVLTVLAAYAMGAAARTRRLYAGALEERARHLEQEREAEAERASARERARIAADMHDILGHAVSLMVVQAEAGRSVVRTDPDRVESALAAIGDAGRDAMEQLRRLLGLLKTEAGRGPQPTTGSVSDLVAQVRAAGLEVRLEVRGEPRPLTPDTEVAAYRIVQEALTNTVKHAGAAAAEVRLIWTGRCLEIEVEDQGRGGDPTGSTGHGLVGIQERARACGGTAHAGPGESGTGFVVTARLPLTPAAAVVTAGP